MLEEKDGKINDYNEIFAFFQGWKTMNKRCDKLNYLVVLRAQRQLLLLQRAVGKPGEARAGWKMAGDKDNIFFFYATRPTEAQLKRDKLQKQFLMEGEILSAFFKLVPLQRLDRGMKISWAADKGMQSDICQSL